VVESKLRQPGGLAYAGTIDPSSYELINHCRGQAPLGEVLGQVAATIGQDLAEILPASLEVVRSLVEQGFLLPPERGPAAFDPTKG